MAQINSEQKRNSYLALMKSTNQMYDDYRKEIMQKEDMDEVTKRNLLQQIEEIQQENLLAVRTYANATPQEMENVQLKEVSDEEKAKYANHLKKRNLTDEQVHSKVLENATTATTSGQPIQRRQRKTKTEDFVMTEEQRKKEEEIMRASMYTKEKHEAWKKELAEYEKNFKGIKLQHVLDPEKSENTKPETTYVTPKEVTKEDVKSNITMTPKPKAVKAENVTKVTPNKQENVTPSPEKLTENVKTQQTTIENKIQQALQAEVKISAKKPSISIQKQKLIEYDFDFSQIPPYVEYDILPLPSNGECYPIDSPLRSGRIPVAYLTASDENLITSPNMYRDGKIIDVILARKILDKRINPNVLCRGDRDYIVMWLRASGYGPMFPIVVDNPNDSSKKYHTQIDLRTIPTLDFKLIGDEEGYFDYTLERVNGQKDEIKFKILSFKENEILRETAISGLRESEKDRVAKEMALVRNIIKGVDDIDKSLRDNLFEDVDEILAWATPMGTPPSEEEDYSRIITENLIFCTVSVNGNRDREFIRGYVENMRSIDSYKYRTYLMDNIPGVDFNITVNIPESDGGGSISSFLGIDDAIFLNV